MGNNPISDQNKFVVFYGWSMSHSDSNHDSRKVAGQALPAGVHAAAERDLARAELSVDYAPSAENLEVYRHPNAFHANLAPMEAKTKICGLPKLFNFEPNVPLNQRPNMYPRCKGRMASER